MCIKIFVESLLEFFHPDVHLTAHVVVAVGHLKHAVVINLAERGWGACDDGIVGIESAFPATFFCGLDQQ